MGPPAAPAAPPASGLPPAPDRGALRIADRAVERIAAWSAREALAHAPAASLVPPGRRPRASVSVRGGAARISLAVEAGYPDDLGALCGSVQRHVASRVGELTGMKVPEVAVEVVRLHLAAPGVLGGSAG